MAELQRSHPEAESHLFAISGVSGGSLGAVTYAALRDGGRNNAGTTRQYREAAEQVMTSDMLSPTVASLLGPEMVQVPPLRRPRQPGRLRERVRPGPRARPGGCV